MIEPSCLGSKVAGLSDIQGQAEQCEIMCVCVCVLQVRDNVCVCVRMCVQVRDKEIEQGGEERRERI